MTFIRRIFLFVFLSILPLQVSAMETSAKQAYIVDMGTGMVLLDKNANEHMPTSSMSKVMTAYMVFEAIEEGRIEMATKLPVSEKAWSKGGSKMFVEAGDEVSVDNLLKGLIVQSGNDAAIVLSEGVAGDEDQFAIAMTARAQQLGMKDSQFKNASGWPDPDHYSTAHDLALLGQRLIVDFPHYYSLYSIKEFTYNDITQPNRNPLLYRDMGVDGIKTGHTEVGGYGLMASGEKNGRRVVMVVNGLASQEDRANESARLMNWAMNSFENIDIVKKGTVVDQAPAAMGKGDVLPLTVSRDVRLTVPLGQREGIAMKANYMSPIKAPIKAGEKVGDLVIDVPQLGDFTVPLVAAADLEEAGFFGRTFSKMNRLLFGE